MKLFNVRDKGSSGHFSVIKNSVKLKSQGAGEKEETGIRGERTSKGSGSTPQI